MTALPPPALFDAHNHLHDAWLLPHRAEIIRDLAKISPASAVVNGTCESDWADVAHFCSGASPFTRLVPTLHLRPSYGLHPWHVGNASARWRDALRHRLDADPAAVVGEIGLDRWILDRAKPDDSRLAGLRRATLDEQLTAFTAQLTEAAERNLPATIHCLDAWGALAATLHSTRLPERGFLLHAYGGSLELARELIPLGAYFSFNGHFLAPRHEARRAVFAQLPHDRLLVETDAPAMPLPEDQRRFTLPDLADGTTLNHPANLVVACSGLAALRQMPLAQLLPQLAANATRLFGSSPL